MTSQYSTLYRTHKKTFRTKLKNTLNKFEEIKDNKKQLDNKNLLQKQNQYILNINNKLITKELKKKLASQEKALTSNSSYEKKINNMVNFLSRRLNKNKSDIMMATTDDYRTNKDIKAKLTKLMKKAFPEYNYKWKNDLRNTEREKCAFKLNKYNGQQISRNPFYISKSSRNEKIFTKTEDEYIKNNVPKTTYRKFIKEIRNVKGNLNELLIEGQNLLKYEQDLIKQIKGKKVIINYDNTFQDRDLTEALYAYNINVNNI